MIILEVKILKKLETEIINNIKSRNLFNIGNRSKAIENSILNADPNEIILVAGKGHEKNKFIKIKQYKFQINK